MLLISFFPVFLLLTASGTGERHHSSRLSKRRRGGLARGGKRCYSLSGGYVTSHLPPSPRNARIVFVNRAAMCVYSRGESFLSRCPSCLTPEVNPDIDTCSRGQQQSLRQCAILTEPYHSNFIITPPTVKHNTALLKSSLRVIVGIGCV